MASKRKTRPSSSTSVAAAAAAGASSSKKARIVEPPAEDFSDFEKEEPSSSSGIPAGEQEEERNSVAVRANGGRRNVQQRRSRERGGGSNPESSSTAQSENLKSNKADDDDDDGPFARLFGDPVPDEEARTRWPHRYLKKEEKQRVGSRTLVDTDDSEEKIPARRHYLQAEVDGHTLYNLYDDGHVQAADGEESYICRIVEIFEADDGTPYFTAQWYYRATDTVIKKAVTVDNKRVFFSEIQNDNPLECLVGKLKIVKISLNLDLEEKMSAIHGADYYCDTLYLLPYSTFANLPPEKVKAESDSSSTISTDDDGNMVSSDYNEVCRMSKHPRSEATLLDLYSGCGAMSTGLCLGAKKSGLNLVTRWAVDLNKYACESLKLNHPETEVRNESAEDFLSLLKEWEKLCVRFSLISGSNARQHPYPFDVNDGDGDTQEDEGDNEDDNEDDSEVFEVDRIIQICYGDPNKSKEPGLYFKVSWKKYGPDYDTWEPIEGLSNCRDAIQEFVVNGYKSRILPLPGHVDVICGGPPCQGVSGFNRFRNRREPLEDEKNKQLVVFMDIVNYLRPKFVLMENVVDILKFADGFLGRYALGRLVDMNYQSRLGMMAAGAYGLPQFRMRAFLWGAHPTKRLPQYPLPTHDVVVRGVVPLQFESNVVAYDAGSDAQLEKKLLLKDAISDLPAVENNEDRDEMPYDKNSETEFQEQIRLRNGLLGSKKDLLYDHRPLKLNEDDFERVCQIPQKKGANFRDLPGVIVGPDNKVEWDPNVERVLLKSGKPLVPDYAMSFVNGTSSKPFARLWWDETVPTVVTRAEPHNQAILHPEQDRVLSIRENARLQGFPDCYKLCGPIKERYIQVGNAVAVPVARALGYALGMAFQGLAEDQPLFTLPKKFPNVLEKCSAGSSDEDA